MSTSTAPLTALIVDDERLARKELRRILGDFSDRITVIGEAKNKRETVEFLASLPDSERPDVIFLDINMPQGSGFTVLEEIDYNGDNPIHIVFVTAYDEYALRAFSVNALDYILKPIDKQRLENTINRLWKLSGKTSAVLRNMESSHPTPQHDAVSKKNTLQSPDNYSPDEEDAREPLSKLVIGDYLFLPIGKQRRFTALTEIVCITANGNYTELRLVDGKRALMLRTMGEWEEILPEPDFQRIHRGTIINCAYLDPSRQMEQSGRGAVLYLWNIPEPFVVSRRSYGKIKEIFPE
jgi:two-component system LytT family response regulator